MARAELKILHPHVGGMEGSVKKSRFTTFVSNDEGSCDDFEEKKVVNLHLSAASRKLFILVYQHKSGYMTWQSFWCCKTVHD